MPELPEVEAARVLVQEHCKGKCIEKAIAADDTKVIEGITPTELQDALLGKTMVEACRKGKHLWLELDSGSPALMLHFGMTGYIVVEGVPIVQYVNAKKPGDEWPPKYWKLVLEMEGGLKLAFCDPRRFGKIRMIEDPASNEPISKLGFDPILSMPDLEAFTAQLATQRRAIKALILDQSFSAGVGNWVADEVLYQAKIHPEQKAATLDEAQCAALHEQMQAVLRTAVDAGANSGMFPDTWLFHQKWSSGKKGPAPVLGGNKIEFMTVGGRVRRHLPIKTTAYVPAVQKMPKKAAGKAQASKPAKKKASKVAAGNIDEGEEGGPPPPGSGATAAAPKAAAKRAAPKRAASTAPAKAAAAQQCAADDDADEKAEEQPPASKPRKPSNRKAPSRQAAAAEGAPAVEEATADTAKLAPAAQAPKSKKGQKRQASSKTPAATEAGNAPAKLEGKRRKK